MGKKIKPDTGMLVEAVWIVDGVLVVGSAKLLKLARPPKGRRIPLEGSRFGAPTKLCPQHHLNGAWNNQSGRVTARHEQKCVTTGTVVVRIVPYLSPATGQPQMVKHLFHDKIKTQKASDYKHSDFSEG